MRKYGIKLNKYQLGLMSTPNPGVALLAHQSLTFKALLRIILVVLFFILPIVFFSGRKTLNLATDYLKKEVARAEGIKAARANLSAHKQVKYNQLYRWLGVERKPSSYMPQAVSPR